MSTGLSDGQEARAGPSPQPQHEHDKTIPIYVRIVPKDIWLRMHVDMRATVGSVKDAILEKVQLPPHDPSMFPHFYEEARSAMARQGAGVHEVRSLPKAFLARMPKPSIGDLIRSERKADANSIFSAAASTVGPASRKVPTVKSLTPSAQARAILGGDAGSGGRGSMGYVGHIVQSDGLLYLEDALSHSSPRVAWPLPASNSLTSQSDARANAAAGPSVISASSSSPLPHTKRSSAVLTKKSPRRDTSSPTPPPGTADSPSAGIDRKKSDSSSNRAGTTVSNQPASTSLSDNDDDDSKSIQSSSSSTSWQGRLMGNEEAKRLEEEAMMKIRAAEGRMPSRKPSLLHDALSSAPASDSLKSAPVAPRDSGEEGDSIEEEDREMEGIDEKEYDDLDLDSGRSSSASSRPSMEDLEGKGKRKMDTESNAQSRDWLAKLNSSSSSTGRSVSPTSSRGGGERARSGTIMPSDVHRRAAAAAKLRADTQGGEQQQQPAQIIQGSSTPSTINTSSSSEMNVLDADMLLLPGAALPTQAAVTTTAADSTTGSSSSRSISISRQRGNSTMDRDAAAKLRSTTPNQHLTASSLPTGGLARRLAGIYTDEISSWRDAQHSQARFFSIHSYSNGHMLEDWRTIAAFHIRPFELLEVHFADPRDKVRLPRVGQAVGHALRKNSRSDKDDEGALFTVDDASISTGSPTNPALDSRYLEPYCEFWCYVFKRGSGSSRTQRAGLGLWKLRWVCLHSNRLFIFRNKPPRYAFEEAVQVWNLDAIESVLSERADGATRPLLLPLAGQCEEVLTLTFRRQNVATSYEENFESSNKSSVSIRFITQLDYTAFFRSCSRAHNQAASRRSNDLQGRTPLVYEWRRKALARATIAGLGGTVVPGKAARRRGRNALARARLRPPGVKRDFDDADRWSSESEIEDVRPASKGEEEQQEELRPPQPQQAPFRYTEALASQSQADLVSTAPFTPTPSMPMVSYFSHVGDGTSDSVSQSGHSIGKRPNTGLSSLSASSNDRSLAAEASPLRVSKRNSGSAASGSSIRRPEQSESVGRRRGFSLAVMYGRDTGSARDQASVGGGSSVASQQNRLHHASSMRYLSPGTGQGDFSGYSPLRQRSAQMHPQAHTSPLRSSAERRRESHPTSAPHGIAAAAQGPRRQSETPPSPSPSPAQLSSTTKAIRQSASESYEDRSETIATSSSPNTTALGELSISGADRRDDADRPISSPTLDEEQSPAAQAIYSYLAQRSASTSSNLGRLRSSTISHSPSSISVGGQQLQQQQVQPRESTHLGNDEASPTAIAGSPPVFSFVDGIQSPPSLPRSPRPTQ